MQAPNFSSVPFDRLVDIDGEPAVRIVWPTSHPDRSSPDMPVYEYECKACGRDFEYQQRMTDPDKTTCEVCGGALARLISRTAFSLKGGGWYKDLYASPKPEKADKADGSSEGGAKPDAKPDAPAASSPSSDGGSTSGTSSGTGSTSGTSSGTGSTSSGGSTGSSSAAAKAP
jgi:putative FmdB family regulatory protein